MFTASAEFSDKNITDYNAADSSGGYTQRTDRTRKGSLGEGQNFPGIIGASDAFKQALRAVEIVAPTDSTVLILGETGTGKELIAKAIHRLSWRAPQKFARLNCAAIPASLFEAELFGHERGAFTGAVNQRVGRFETAHKGTLFLDEIGDMPLELQPKLLRVLQEQEFERLGSSRTQKVDVRMVAATNQDLLDRVDEGEFRRDLYYRLNVFPIKLPPLRERREDINLLANYFASSSAGKMQKQLKEIPPSTLKILLDYDYPGNVRELQNIIERAVILTADGILHAEHLQLDGVGLKRQNLSHSTTLADFERRFILQTLKENNWQVGGKDGAAMRLGMKRTTLISKMEKLGIGRQREQQRIY